MASGVCWGVVRAPTRQSGALHRGVSEPRQEEVSVHTRKSQLGVWGAELVTKRSVGQLSKQIKEMGAWFLIPRGGRYAWRKGGSLLNPVLLGGN